MQLTVEEALSQGWGAQQDGELAKAKALYSAILAFDKEHPVANHRLGMLFLEANDAGRAVSYLKSAFLQDPNRDEHWTSFFSGLVKAGRFNEARLLLKASEKRGLQRTQIEGMRDRLREEIQRLNPPPSQLEPLLEAIKRSNVELVQGLADELLNLYPKSFEVHNILGVFYANSGRLTEASDSFQCALKANPEYPDALNNLGGALKMLNDWQGALNSFKTTLEIDPSHADALFNLGNLLKDLGQYQEAVPFLKRCLDTAPGNHAASIDLGICLSYLNQYGEACACLENGLTHLPDSYAGHYSLATVFWATGEYRRARSELDWAISLAPNRKLARIARAALINQSSTGVGAQAAERPNIVNDSINQVFVDNIPADQKLLHALYAVQARSFDDPTVVDTRFGPGACNLDFYLCENPDPEIQKMTKRLTKVMVNAVGGAIEIYGSFFNIAKAGSGSRPHEHTVAEDKHFGLRDICYSLVYYLDVGDQNCKDPGVLKILEPDVDFLPKNGDVVIIHGTRRHFATYGGNSDRVLVGINFYATGTSKIQAPQADGTRISNGERPWKNHDSTVF